MPQLDQRPIPEDLDVPLRRPRLRFQKLDPVPEARLLDLK